MKKKLSNINSELLNMLTLGIGIILVLTSFLTPDDYSEISTVLISVGSSIIASGIIVYLSSHYLFKQSQIKDILNLWKLNAIYKTRAEMNLTSNELLGASKKNLDIIAFGLKGFREVNTQLIENKVSSGLKIRILTMDPKSPLLKIREDVEGQTTGQIANTIEQLSDWVENLKKKARHKNHIQIKYYDSLPLDFYFRIDQDIFVGPYLYSKSSQQTISYHFAKGGEGFDYWESYFDEVWQDTKLIKEKL